MRFKVLNFNVPLIVINSVHSLILSLFLYRKKNRVDMRIHVLCVGIILKLNKHNYYTNLKMLMPIMCVKCTIQY